MEQHCYLPDGAHQQQEMERPSELQELADRASRYSIDLTNRISRNSGRVLPGGSALVYRGTLIPDGTEVAIKTFRCTRSSKADLKHIFREVHVWSKLRHENVVRMLGISTEFDSTVSIISEWMPLGDAHAYIQDTTNDPRPLLQDIASGLDYLHSHELGPIVHGDLKGLNVLVSSDHRALLSDFGLATLSTSTFTMTVDIKRGGSCHWMAPELLDECPASMESDVWSYGMTALELFTRAVPYPNCRSSANVLGMLMKRKLPPRPAEESTQFRLTDTWWEICMSCWQSDPSLRPTMKDIAKKVKAGISQASPALTLPHKASTSAHPISNEACQYTNPVTSSVAVSYTTTGRALESSALMKTAPEYPASTADTNNPLSSTGSLTCVTTIRQTPPIADDNDSINPKGNNVKDNSQPTATAKMPQPAGFPLQLKNHLSPLGSTSEDKSLPPPLPDREALGSEAARSDSVIGQASESLDLMKTALQDLAADTNMSPSVSLTSNSGTLQTPPTAKNDSVKPKRNNTEEDAQPKCAMESQMSLLASTLGEGSQSVDIREISTTDIIVGLMGPPGSGKSSFVAKALGSTDKGIGHHLWSLTSEIEVTRCTVERSSVVLIEFLGFDDTWRSDLMTLEMISHWLNKGYQHGIMLSAILYFHRIVDSHMGGNSLKNLRVFQNLCGKNAMPKVVLVTTAWDEVHREFGEETLAMLKDSYWKTMISQGCTTFRHMNTQESAVQLLNSIVQRGWAQEKVQLQEEIIDRKLELHETAAGRVLCPTSTLGDLARRRMEVLRRIRDETKEADQRTAEDLWKEYAQVKAQLDSDLTQVRALRMPLRPRLNETIRAAWRSELIIPLLPAV
ncbi:hypothetical protein BKA82DRAFT_22651 [Pisolithus tinctorius]|uniref:Protein kinase domain-containing protein n=1 Tax=Pisolithus tinctorius Marx 270 TaxID=870435 RepID=A0A0C3PKM4_PISTI|nr:hypothetical protein BKA82DRAFT_22651 [Pisolithus tinctorius]KIO08794.1 hypothetical protein M404DRAFT_22651 [Pisolithus tinctorius Marx 270]